MGQYSQLDYWRLALALKLRESVGDAFQDFFSNVMAKVHGDMFVRVKPMGPLGDKGCDGYLMSGEVFQCYGALNGGKTLSVSYLVSKMETDYKKASEKLGPLMKSWTFVNNLVDGVPIEAIQKLDELAAANKHHKFAFLGKEGIEAAIFGLKNSEIEGLLGIAATAQDQLNLKLPELQALISNVAAQTETAGISLGPIGPVPVDKLELNKLPAFWCNLIQAGWQNQHLVDEYLRRHPVATTGETIAQVFRAKYKSLKIQNLTPGDIMSDLYLFVTGPGAVDAKRQVAAQALLAYLFESCDIFEDRSEAVSL